MKPALVFTILVVLAATGCGEPESGGSARQPVTPTQLATQPRGGPAHTTLSYWRELQEGSASRVVQAMTPCGPTVAR